MTELEDIIHKNRSAFDEQEPDPGHFDRFEKRLKTMSPSPTFLFKRRELLKVAAVILFLITASVLVFDLTTREIRDRFFKGQVMAELPLEVREAMQYYDQQVNLQLGEIKRLANTSMEAKEICQSAFRQIKALDDNTLELRKNLNENPGNGRIQDAILQNQKMKEGVLNTIVTQLNNQKK